MSFPYYLDLSFGSEKSTADPQVSRVPENVKQDSNQESNPSQTSTQPQGN